ncbi:MAG: hypothetical protein WA005_12060 [Candidatus Binataceae bacterium]
MTKREVLNATTFGKTTAEDERLDLSSYFVETDQWRRIFSGETDVVYGAKGSGKSAIYALLLSRRGELRGRGIIVVPCENPQGAPAFKDVAADPPTDEAEFRNLWKLYLLLMVARQLGQLDNAPESTREVTRLLEEAQLLPPAASLSAYLRGALDYVRRWMRAEKSVEAELKLDPATGLPVGVAGRLTFKEPTKAERGFGMVSADELLAAANAALEAAGLRVWLLLDRLDVAFAESPQLERNALRALFRVYLDLLDLTRISSKIFLRTDIWRQITEAGFREASHITRQDTISWDETSLLNLVVRRALHNEAVREFYGVDEQATLRDVSEQYNLFYRMFPSQVDPGSRRPQTLNWILDRTCDGSQRTAPRELIHLLSTARNKQLRRLELGESEPPGDALFDRVALKEGLPEVSRVRLGQTLFAEYPGLRKYIAELEGEKTLQTAASLTKIWDLDGENAAEVANQLVEVGFFERRGTSEDPQFWVPFLYRSALSMVQGSAE